ncbi:MAG: hypothetical protein AB8C13_03815 [Phycisphaerales bacterium]
MTVHDDLPGEGKACGRMLNRSAGLDLWRLVNEFDNANLMLRIRIASRREHFDTHGVAY